MQLKRLVKTWWRRLCCLLVPQQPEVVWTTEAAARKAELQQVRKPHEPEVLGRELPRYLVPRDDRPRRWRKQRHRQGARTKRRSSVNVNIDIDIS